MADIIPLADCRPWDDLIRGSSGELFLSRDWLGVVSRTFGLTFHAVVERDGERITGGLPFCRIDDLRGPRITILPFCDFVFPVIRDAAQAERLLAPLFESGVPMSCSTSADSILAIDQRFAASQTTVRQYIAIDAELPAIELRYKTMPKRMLQRASAAGLNIRPARTIDELRAFYLLHLKVRKHRYGMLCQPYALFEAIWETFLTQERGALMLGFDGDTVVGGALLIEIGKTLVYKFAASHEDYRASGVSHAVAHGGIAMACARGLTTFDFGRSDMVQTGLVDFKRRFGAISEPLATLKWQPEGLPKVNQGGELLGQISRLLSRPDVPDALTEEGGNILYRHFA